MIQPLARRRPWKVAREATTLDHVSNGRFVLCVGLGAADDAGWGKVGEPTDRRTRAERLDETLEILTGLWSGAFGSPAQPMSGVQISLSGDHDADAELTGYYEKLAAAGTVVEPLAAAPWGDKFGMVSDPYGILWMVAIAGAQPAG